MGAVAARIGARAVHIALAAMVALAVTLPAGAAAESAGATLKALGLGDQLGRSIGRAPAARRDAPAPGASASAPRWAGVRPFRAQPSK